MAQTDCDVNGVDETANCNGDTSSQWQECNFDSPYRIEILESIANFLGLVA